MKENKVVSVKNMLVEASYRMNPTPKKLLTSLITFIQNKGEVSSLTYEVDAREAFERVGIPVNHEQLARDCRALMKELRAVEVDHVDWDKDEWEFFSFVDGAKYKQGKLKFRISPEFSKCIFKLKREFTQYLIDNIKPLKSQYSIRIYELLRQHWKEGEWTVEVDWLRSTLKAPKYKHVDFEARVMQRAQKEINEKTDIQYSHSYEQVGRKYKYVTFSISMKGKKRPIQQELPEMPSKTQEMLDWERDLLAHGVKPEEVFKTLNQVESPDYHLAIGFWIEVLRHQIDAMGKRARTRFVCAQYDLLNDTTSKLWCDWMGSESASEYHAPTQSTFNF